MDLNLTDDEHKFLKNILIDDFSKKLKDDYADLELDELLALDTTEFKLTKNKVHMFKSIIRKLI